MTCIKTGCDVYLKSHGGALHGDMFKVSDVYILHHCSMDKMDHDMLESDCDYIFDAGPAAYLGEDLALGAVNIVALPAQWVTVK